MRILHIPPRYPPSIGGSETWCAGLARWQRSQGHEVDVLTLRAVQDDELWGEGPVLPTSIAVGASDVDGGIRIRRFSQGRVGPGAGWLFWRMGISSLTYSHSAELYGFLPRAARAADVVHAHTVPGPHLFACRLAAFIARRPFVITPHFHAGDPAHDQAPTRWMLRHADAVFAVSRAEAGELAARGVPARNIITTSNAIDRPLSRSTSHVRATVREALELPGGSPLITFLGRKAASKSIDLLLDALPLIRRRPPPVLALAGPATTWYRELGDRVRGDNIRDLPPLSETAKSDLLAASDLLVLPSKREAFGIVFLEAWSAGTAVVGADIPPVREVIGDAGQTFRPDDAVDLAARIDELLATPEEARAMAERGRQRINDLYTWERVGSSVMNGYALAALKGTRHSSRS